MRISFTKLIETGVRPNDTTSQKRSVIFSNFISLILCAASFSVVVIVPGNRTFIGFRDAIIGMAVFSVPLLLNRFSFTNISRFYLCWVPPILITWLMIVAMRQIPEVPVSLYSGLRIYVLSTSCIPYLFSGRNRPGFLFLGIVPSFLILLFCDPLLDYFGVGHATKGIPDPGYGMIHHRTLIAYLIIGGTCLALKFIIEKADDLNQRLFAELEQKNLIIQRHAESELHQLNEQLLNTITELSKRELILKRSQEIAKVGSWELILPQRSVFWSDQVYEIFGVEKSIDLQDPKLGANLFEESAPVISDAISELIKSRKPYDFTLRTKTPMGYKKWVRIVGFPMVLNDEVIAATGIVHDVTLFKESEEQIKASERSYRSLFEQASDAIAITDLQGNFLEVNPSMCKMLGFTKEELLPMNISHTLDPEELKLKPMPFKRLIQGEQIFNERRMIRKDGSVVHVEANVKMFMEGKLMAIGRDISERKMAELEKEKITYQLNERVKELTTLYRCGQILQTEKRPVHEVLQEIVNLLPDGWQYPSITAARISLAQMEFVTPNFATYKHRQFSEFITHNNLYGTIEVVYLEEKPDEAEGPFLAEERYLINMVSEMIRGYLSRRYEAEALRRTEANQSATINNTNFFIWSVDHDYEIISYNKPFAEFMKTQFGFEINLGSRITDDYPRQHEEGERWRARFNRALAGETFKVNTSVRDRKFEYALNPIIEGSKIIGVSVFGEDITDRLKREQELLTANKQLGELKLMALRSAMNPHFIFNCLNSIQYYILENDQKNAVSYLSTFSKLVRSILHNSVHNRVRLAEELDVLRHYIQLEALRFENKFDAVIHVDETVDVEGIEIPSMLIQPYVENAILHGLYNKKDKGLLKISVKSTSGRVLVEIEDNGIGRRAASEQRQLNLPKHKSMGTALTEERLKLINSEGDTAVETIDLAVDGKAAGTLVRIYIKE